MNYWDTQANRWGVFSVPDEDYSTYTRRQAVFIVEQLAIDVKQLRVEKGIVRDVGCGIGRLTFEVAHEAPYLYVVGVDPSHTMIEVARGRLAENTYLDHRLDFAKTSDGKGLSGGYDGAWCVLVFQHLIEAPIREILRDVADTLQPGARFVSQWMLDKDQAFPREADVLRVLMDEGFENVRLHGDADVTRLWFADNWLWVTSERTP